MSDYKNIPEYKEFSERAKQYLESTSAPEPMLPERATSAACSADGHIVVSDGGSVTGNLQRRCMCGQYTLAEIFARRK